MSTFARELVCRVCGATQPLGPTYVCEECFGPLEVRYDYEAIASRLRPNDIERGPLSLWRYRALLPLLRDDSQPVDIGTGMTPLIRADRLAERLGLRHLYIKNDAVNPSYSFKDRAVSVATTAARDLGFDTLACASTGNLANSVAAHAARAGMRAVVFIPADLEPNKIVASGVYGPTIVAVEGTYDDVNRLATLVAEEYGWAFVNVNLRPFYAEGAKTLAYEVAEALGWQAPDHIIAPMASGALLCKIAKGFRELARVGLVAPKNVRISGAQARGCSPIVTALEQGTDQIVPQTPNTIAKSLAIGTPADGPFAIHEIRSSNGRGVAVTDREIVEGVKLLAETEGIFTETAGGVTVAALKRLAESGAIDPEEVVVVYITGNGLKTPDALDGHLNNTVTVSPSLADLERALGTRHYEVQPALV